MLHWGSIQDETCLRVDGLSAAALSRLASEPAALARRLRLYPADVLRVDNGDEMQSVAGSSIVDAEGGAVSFVPRFPFMDGRAYTVLVHRSLVASGADDADADADADADGEFLAYTITRPAREVEPTTGVVDIWPTADAIPRNALRVYVQFSAPMSEGFATKHVRVLDSLTGLAIDDALLTMNPELWDRRRCRLTMLFDPARIKRGLVPHEEVGYALVVGAPIEIVVDEGFLDAKGQPLVESRRRRYDVVEDVRELIDLSAWNIVSPGVGSGDALVVEFDRPLDHGLLQHCLTVVTADGRRVDGDAGITRGEGAWAFRPDDPWPASPLRLAVDPILEDTAGNSLTRVFDRDLSDAEGARAEPTPHRPPSGPEGVDLIVVASR